MIFIPFLRGHYAADTYNIANIGYKEYAIKWSLNDGRLIMAFIGLIAWKTNISIEMYVFFTLLFALFISDIAVVVLYNIITKYKQPNGIIKKITLLCICFITIFNFMYIEDLYFVESIVMALSILLYLLSADILVQKKKNHKLISLILCAFGVLCYQGTIGMNVAFLILFTILKNKNDIKEIILSLLKGAVISLIAVIVNILSVKIVGYIYQMQQERLGNISNLFNNIVIIIKTMKYILQNTCNFFPRNAFLIFLGIITMIVLVYQIINIKEKNGIWYKYCTVLLITLSGSNLTYLLTLTSFLTGRLRNALGALIGILFLLLFVETYLFDRKKIICILTYFVLFTYITITIFNYEKIMLEHRIINILEQQEVEKIESYIEQYEKDNSVKVSNIANVLITNDPNKAYFTEAEPVTYNAVRTNWADDGVINFYTKRKLKKQYITLEKFEEIIENNTTNLEYICKEDTLYLKVYIY